MLDGKKRSRHFLRDSPPTRVSYGDLHLGTIPINAELPRAERHEIEAEEVTH